MRTDAGARVALEAFSTRTGSRNGGSELESDEKDGRSPSWTSMAVELSAAAYRTMSE